MQVPQLREKGGVSVNMTPLIDVVFLLIIFFLVYQTAKNSEEGTYRPDVDPPASTGGEEMDLERPRLVINITKDGETTIASRKVTQADIVRVVKKQLEDTGPDFEVEIEGSREAAYKHVSPVLLAVTSAGVWNVTFVVAKKVEGN
jgi:biopolymer transport protein ExbD